MNLEGELGGNSIDIEIDELYEKAAGKEWSMQTQLLFEKEARKLERLSPQSPDYSMQSHYVNTCSLSLGSIVARITSISPVRSVSSTETIMAWIR